MIEIETPCRLHFGLLAYNPDESRQFGGMGLMVRRPCIRVRVAPAEAFGATGSMAKRAIEFAQRFLTRLVDEDARDATRSGAKDRARDTNNESSRDAARPFDAVHITVLDAPRSHIGLGTGTQLGMAVGRAIAELLGRDDLGVRDIARLVGRGARSAIGAYGSFHGGLIVEGGKRRAGELSPMLVQQSFPTDWRLVLIMPKRLIGVSGERETAAFAGMSPIPRSVTAEMCRLVLLGLLPAAMERDLAAFGEALYSLQQRVGQCFASAQGGVYADERLGRIVQFIRDEGVAGVGQSSWGPTLYAVTRDEDAASHLAAAVAKRFKLDEDEVLITEADNEGCRIEPTGTRSRLA